nr:RNA-dependent RNA polymerase [Durnavirales sp.]
MRYDASVLSSHFDSLGVRGVTRLFKYDRRGAKETIARMASSSGIVVEGHLLRVFQEMGYDVDPVRDNKSEYDPRVMFNNLGKYEVPKVSYDSEMLGRAIALSHKVFGHREGFEKLRALSFDYELFEALKLDKSSGAPVFDSKDKAFKEDLARSERIAANKCAPPPCVAYHRVQHGVEGPKVRLVWGYPLSMTLLEARFARPLIQRFLSLRTPMTFGLVKHQLGARVLESQRNGFTYGLDFSKFDSSLPTRIMHTAFEILKTHFSLNPENEVVWEKVVNYFHHTTILMPDGFVYQKHCGVPSGSYFTQLVGSIANYIIIQYMVMVVAGRAVDDRLVNVIGDDSLFTLSQRLDLEKFARVAKELGMTLNILKSGIYGPTEAPSFVGHEWHAGIPDRAKSEIIKRMIFPERPSHFGVGKERDYRETDRLMAYVGDARSAWDLAISTQIFGGSPDLTAYQLLHRRSGYPITGMEEIRSIFGEGVPTVAKTMLLGLIR